MYKICSARASRKRHLCCRAALCQNIKRDATSDLCGGAHGMCKSKSARRMLALATTVFARRLSHVVFGVGVLDVRQARCSARTRKTYTNLRQVVVEEARLSIRFICPISACCGCVCVCTVMLSLTRRSIQTKLHRRTCIHMLASNKHTHNAKRKFNYTLGYMLIETCRCVCVFFAPPRAPN